MVEFLMIIGLALLLNQFLARIKVSNISDKVGYQNTAKWSNIANRYGFKYGIPKKIVLGIIYVESRGIETAIGSVNEGGLMQITNNALKDIQMSYIDKFNPIENIEAGTKYLKHLFDKTENISLAIRAYNTGYSRVKRNPKAGQYYFNKVMIASELFT